MKKIRILKVLSATTLSMMIMSCSISSIFAETEETVIDTVDIPIEDVFNDWINYPDASLGYSYNAGWSYNKANETEPYDFINTTQNVGWTGFYNPNIDNFTTGTFEFDMKNLNFDPCGFTWGLVTGGTEENPVYSFYAFEECHNSQYWSVSYISEWYPKNYLASHSGPLYHGTIDASDGYYDHLGKDANYCGFAEGEVLAYGNLDVSIEEDLSNNYYTVKIEIGEESTSIYINNQLLTTINAPVQAGSFGPFATSNPDAYFKNMKILSTNNVMLNPIFSYNNEDGDDVNEAYVGDVVTVKDLSTFEGSEITEYYWTVTKDGEEIYSGNTPYTEYTNNAGSYETSLRITNTYGISSDIYLNSIIVKEIPNTLTPSFSYISNDIETNEITIGDNVMIINNSSYTGSPIAEYNWTVTKNGETVYTGTIPYDKYSENAGEYITTLVIKNEAEEISNEFSSMLKVVVPATPPQDEKPTDIPDTGDNSKSLFGIFSLLCGSSIIGSILLYFRKRKIK